MSFLNFVRGVDLTGNEIDGSLPSSVAKMQNMLWLKLNRSKLSYTPQGLLKLKTLENVSFARNEISDLDYSIGKLKSLRSLNCRHNKIDSVQDGMFSDFPDLMVIDLSYNKINKVPETLCQCKSLLVIALGHNNFSQVPAAILQNCLDLQFLDLSYNEVTQIPPQMRRLVFLEHLNLAGNPIASHTNMRGVFALHSLTSLNIGHTSRTDDNIPDDMADLVNLTDLDISANSLTTIPAGVLALERLERLNIAENAVVEIPGDISNWKDTLRSFNASRNKLRFLPVSLSTLGLLRTLMVNFNELTIDGISPVHFKRMTSLRVLGMAHNGLTTIPVDVCFCESLQSLLLQYNDLETLPPEIYSLCLLRTFNIDNNPRLIMPIRPKKPIDPDALFYNADFESNRDGPLSPRRLDGAFNAVKNDGVSEGHPSTQDQSVAGKVEAGTLDGVGQAVTKRAKRRMTLQKIKKKDADETANQVLKGMHDVAPEFSSQKEVTHETEKPKTCEAELKGKNWRDDIVKPAIDYSKFFGERVGALSGVKMWVIENFVPVRVESQLVGKFYDHDGYIILHSFYDENNVMDYEIYFWIGAHAAMDKKACAAMHAVNLRNHLGSTKSTRRNEQGDESDEFHGLFANGIEYMEGGTESGFFLKEEEIFVRRLYRLRGTQTLELRVRELAYTSLSPADVFILDMGMQIWVWIGSKSRLLLKSKARLIASKIIKQDRADRATIEEIVEGREPARFWCDLRPIIKPLPPLSSDHTEQELLIAEKNSEKVAAAAALPETRPPGDTADWTLPDEREVVPRPKLYNVVLGKGFLELPQMERDETGRYAPSQLSTNCVFLLDCFADIFIWVGRKSGRLVRLAALKLCDEIRDMLYDRPSFSEIIRIQEGSESVVFKMHFRDWDDAMHVDYGRVGEDVNAPSKVFNQVSYNVGTAHQKKKHAPTVRLPPPRVNVSSLFRPPDKGISDVDAVRFIEDVEYSVDKIECFVLQGQNFVRLPQEDMGIFYSSDCYVYLCRYWKDDPSKQQEGSANGDEDEEEKEDEIECVIYFWEGRHASKMGWLTFTFTFQPKVERIIEENYGCDMTIIRTYQQREPMRLLAHFNRSIVIRQGHRTDEASTDAELYHMRHSPYSLVATRIIKVDPSASSLCSDDCFILKVCFNNSPTEGIIYIWHGSKSKEEDWKVIDRVAHQMKGQASFSVQTLTEGNEPENFFWVGLGGKSEYDHDGDYTRNCRLFQCSNESGVFSVTDMGVYFCQDDLKNTDVMILDPGVSNKLYLWVGPASSDVVKKLSLKSAHAYLEHVADGRTLKCVKIIQKFKEPRLFRRCFHGWDTWPIDTTPDPNIFRGRVIPNP